MEEYIIAIPNHKPGEPDPAVVRSVIVGKLVRCKDCKHRPIIPDNGYDDGFDIDFPNDVCPCQCDGDHYYNWYPPDEWYCPKGERLALS